MNNSIALIFCKKFWFFPVITGSVVIFLSGASIVPVQSETERLTFWPRPKKRNCLFPVTVRKNIG